ncbi:RNA polymerase I-specific transcription initiation factor-like protein [Hapsidospora chrysogenum ATCC 11550]|uniref:RNA polymerase I-specific transcription initiation factor-like protein n=1 Tax=Hapsidospora chrysogenum (strain ATCC 11550 / CBS 779.69 / DSM 880 / IAM 14645 / JCM 23072 / IMI 49137) TaxID=857340 RepID=A0A086TEB4_HAPC1|nr:RNA polymerase I-specific transcription initiation factor-like protein [Hapsidospora chrysogenum ATCC 11550]
MDVDPGYRSEGEEGEDKAPIPRALSPLSLRIRPPPKIQDPDDFPYDPKAEESDAAESEDEADISPLKRTASDPAAHRPLKRQRGVLNSDYLNLLNSEIQDAAQRVSLEDQPKEPPGIWRSQLGLTCWTSIEKHIFFESLARLGKADSAGIAARIGTKSPVEVRHYIRALDEESDRRLRTGNRPALVTAEIPAAVELSQQCCHALDEAADAVSVRQERREQQREEGKWGDIWDLTPDVAKRLEEGEEDHADDQELPSVELFRLSNWLRLSQRIFMNSSIPANNWNHIDDIPPSIWATTFEDFRSLAVSITRRLVQTAIFAASTRIKSTGHRQVIRNTVKLRDVHSAVASLGMPSNSRDFWQKSARRLRLDVFNDAIETDDPEFMTFEEVEEALSSGVHQEPILENEVELTEELSADDTIDQETSNSADEEERAIKAETNEIFEYSVADFPNTARMKQALSARVSVEREQERFAEHSDQYASYREELEMWNLLDKAPPPGLHKVTDPGVTPRSNLDVESLYPLGRDWRRNTQFWSEWETAPRPDMDDE